MTKHLLASDHEVIYATQIEVKPPYISIMIPTYNRYETLCQAIHSALTQKSHVSFEVVIVDNCSEDKDFQQTCKLIHEINDPKLGLIRNSENIGMFRNWNQCIALARGEYITILNDDDMLHPHWMEAVAKQIQGKRMILVRNMRFRHGIDNFSDIRVPISTSSKIRPVSSVSLLDGNPVSGSLGFVISRNAAIELGGYEPTLFPTSDYWFNAKYILQNGGLLLCEVFAFYGIGYNESFNHSTLIKFAINDYLLRLEILSFLKPKTVGKYQAFIKAISLFHSALQLKLYRKIFSPFKYHQKEFIESFIAYGFSRPFLASLHRMASFAGFRMLSIRLIWRIVYLLASE